MAWIELHQSVVTHRKTMAFADALDIPEYAAVGLLSCLWLWAVHNAPDGVLPDSPRTIARAIRWDKEPTALIDALLESENAQWTDAGLIIPDWASIGGNVSERRQADITRSRDRRRFADEVYERDGYACVYCGATNDLTLDHIVPITKGGSSRIENLATACRSCNSSKSGKTPEEWRSGN